MMKNNFYRNFKYVQKFTGGDESIQSIHQEISSQAIRDMIQKNLTLEETLIVPDIYFLLCLNSHLNDQREIIEDRFRQSALKFKIWKKQALEFYDAQKQVEKDPGKLLQQIFRSLGVSNVLKPGFQRTQTQQEVFLRSDLK